MKSMGSTRRRSTLVVPGLLLVLLITAAGGAAADDLQLLPGRWWQSRRLVEQLSLSAEQQDRINTLVYEHARRMVDLSADVRRNELELRQLADQPDFEVKKIRAAYTRFQQSRTRLDSERFELLLSIRQVLSTEQWHELQRLREEHKKHEQREERFSQRQGPGFRFRGGPPPPDDLDNPAQPPG